MNYESMNHFNLNLKIKRLPQFIFFTGLKAGSLKQLMKMWSYRQRGGSGDGHIQLDMDMQTLCEEGANICIVLTAQQ